MFITDDRAETTAPGELLRRARAGDAPAFCRLTEPLQARLLRQAAALAGDLSVAEDLVSETLVEAWKSLDRYDESCRFSTWLYAILLHRRQKLARRARSRPLALAWLPAFQRDDLAARHENLPSPEPSPSENAAQNEISAQLRQCVEPVAGETCAASSSSVFSRTPPCRTWRGSWAARRGRSNPASIMPWKNCAK